jgi:cyclic pyranopterin phosphate synthase
MPADLFPRDHRFLPRSELLDFDEIVRVAGTFVGLGVTKIRLTGGEPLLRKDIELLTERLAGLRGLDDAPVDLALTTNGSLLSHKAVALKAAGLKRVTVSLDGIDDAIFRRMNAVDFPVAKVLTGIETTLRAGFRRVKVNMVVRRGTNDCQILPMAKFFRDNFGPDVVLRFIEYMDVGCSNGWRVDEVFPSGEVVRLLDSAFGLEPCTSVRTGETAKRWRYSDGKGEIGVISSVTQPFCGDCSRVRLSADGRLYKCLFSSEGLDLRSIIRGATQTGGYGNSQAFDLKKIISQFWQRRDDRYSETRSEQGGSAYRRKGRVEMHYIGG